MARKAKSSIFSGCPKAQVCSLPPLGRVVSVTWPLSVDMVAKPAFKASSIAPAEIDPADLKPKAIQAVVKKVAAWQVKVAEPTFNRLWTYAAMYDGLLAASKATGDPAFRVVSSE